MSIENKKKKGGSQAHVVREHPSVKYIKRDRKRIAR